MFAMFAMFAMTQPFEQHSPFIRTSHGHASSTEGGRVETTCWNGGVFVEEHSPGKV
ncbi:hypothetical protein BJF96_g7458 [Verticillium dahliae]|uniref:Uncharacterized protein n=1 Tax=Verticillium dahliae TaxID=27337 RepID=A0AA44WCM3_VERDA|nr:hypothetical protein BJF96_g7458 [Verticillium dahliae]